MSDIYHITRERVVDIYDTRSIRKYARTFRAFLIQLTQNWVSFFVYRTSHLSLEVIQKINILTKINEVLNIKIK